MNLIIAGLWHLTIGIGCWIGVCLLIFWGPQRLDETPDKYKTQAIVMATFAVVCVSLAAYYVTLK